MGARTGQQFLEGVKAQPREVYIEGELVRDVTEHRAFRNVLHSVAHLYDMQHDPALRHDLTYPVPETGERAGAAFMPPRTPAELRQRGRAMQAWAEYSNGMLGRTPDYLSSSLMAFAAAKDYFARDDPRFGENIANYYTQARDRDLCLTHTLINPQANRSVGPSGQADPFLPARVVEERGEGIVISGARMLATLGPLADETRSLPQHRRQDGAGGCTLRLRLRHSVRHAGLEVHLSRDVRPEPLAPRPPARLTVRGDGRSRHLRQRARAVGASLSLRRSGVG